MFDGSRVQGWLLFSWQSRFWQSEHATYPSLYEASRPADARMSISMRLSCKVSRNDCFAMFLHTGGKMDMKLVWDERARNMTKQHVITNIIQQMKVHTENVGQNKETKKKKVLVQLLLRRCQTDNIYLWCPPDWPYLVLYEPCPSLQASCSSLINIRVFWLLQGCDWKKTMCHTQAKVIVFLLLIVHRLDELYSSFVICSGKNGDMSFFPITKIYSYFWWALLKESLH